MLTILRHKKSPFQELHASHLASQESMGSQTVCDPCEHSYEITRTIRILVDHPNPNPNPDPNPFRARACCSVSDERTRKGTPALHMGQAASRSYATVCVYTPSVPTYLPHTRQLIFSWMCPAVSFTYSSYATVCVYTPSMPTYLPRTRELMFYGAQRSPSPTYLLGFPRYITRPPRSDTCSRRGSLFFVPSSLLQHQN